MRFDDRLSTVLGLSAEAPRDRAVQWRQLVELLARGAGSTDPALLRRALDRIAELSPEVPQAVRAAAARAIAGPAVPASLVLLFARDEPEVAAPLLGVAELDDATWEEIRSAASPEVRRLVDTLRPLPVGAPAPPAVAPEPATDSGPRLFRWECGPTGEIDWVEGVPRAAVIGHSVRSALRRRFDAMQPFADEPLALAEEGALAGGWRWSGQPRFLPGSGRFAGYQGIATRDEGSVPRPTRGPEATALPVDHDSLRELIHELRTPLTAIIGFGEIIEGQFLGPAHRAYRDRAGEIVRQARLLLAAVEDLDLAAKLRSERPPAGKGARLASLVQNLPGRVTVTLRDGSARCALREDLAGRLLNRFVEAVTAAAGEDERLELVVDRLGNQVALSLDRPLAARSVGGELLLQSDTPAGLGFSLRLVRGLAQIVGGDLDVASDRFVLLLPAV